MTPHPPDWQLPQGVTRELWHCLHSDDLAQSYDEDLRDDPLTKADVDFVQRHCPPSGWILDAGCGTGRLLYKLSQQGQRVVGVDLSPAMLRMAGAKAAASGLSFDLVQANLIDLACFDDGSFKSAACLFSTLGLIPSSQLRRRFVQHVHRLLCPGGVFVLHVHNRWFNFWQPGGWRLLAWDLVKDFLQRDGAGDRRMSAHGHVPALTLHVFSRREILTLLRQSGFVIREVLPLSLDNTGDKLRRRLVSSLRTYGYLIAALKP